MMKARARQAAFTAGWPDLAAELDRWADAGRVATLWWRDDDAALPGPQLERILSLAGPIPVALAVIPAAAALPLAAALAARPQVAILQHGWRHWSYATDGKKSEFPAGRVRRQVAADLAAGRERLAALFGERSLAALAPPWNRFDASFLPLLAASGIRALSRSQPRSPRPEATVMERDVHVDLVAWRNGRGFIGAGAALGGLVGHLRARRLGAADGEMPTGILTHHLVADAATYRFLQRLAAATLAHPAARWLDGAEVFGRA
jgi:peptidoglycan/xylan/chitin deacetylase (PgdA/CDA1 family)